MPSRTRSSATLAPAEHQELGKLVLVRFAADAAADDYMGGDALGPYRSRDDQADNVELGIWQQTPEPFEPAEDVCPARQPRSKREGDERGTREDWLARVGPGRPWRGL